jgi:hypothetical protein
MSAERDRPGLPACTAASATDLSSDTAGSHSLSFAKDSRGTEGRSDN